MLCIHVGAYLIFVDCFLLEIIYAQKLFWKMFWKIKEKKVKMKKKKKRKPASPRLFPLGLVSYWPEAQLPSPPWLAPFLPRGPAPLFLPISARSAAQPKQRVPPLPLSLTDSWTPPSSLADTRDPPSGASPFSFLARNRGGLLPRSDQSRQQRDFLAKGSNQDPIKPRLSRPHLFFPSTRSKTALAPAAAESWIAPVSSPPPHATSFLQPWERSWWARLTLLFLHVISV